ncbi:LysR family transcriptional regulator [Lederbergia citrea]|uniref:LysR family transcriptional regulator n=1 Tax=Lederbergia citrea TaxID=2833581 RepID=UPI001BCA464E|nr:LysR family transcriptional regulator [Lederbergia citrea]MBS4203641.1 LysR family transcriptional regulator [Lederbergia citrea]
MVANLELYRVFYWTAREQNLSRAAERLYITQPSVSYAIKQLEEQLSIKLFHREARGVRLTDEGTVLFRSVEQAFNFLDSAERHMADINGLVRGELRIGSSDSLCKYYLLPHLGTFFSDYPGIRLDLIHGTTSEIIRYVKEGRIDFGIVRLPVDDNQLVVREATTVQDCFVAGPRYSHLAEKALHLSELIKHPIILFTKKSSSRQFIENFVAEEGLEIIPEIELASVDLLIEFAKVGLGISFVTKQFVTKELDNGALVELKLVEQIPSRKIGIVYLRQHQLSKASSTFIHQYLDVL